LSAAAASRPLDVVVFGATGFVGRLTAGHLARRAGDEVRIGLAGRSLDRLAAVRSGLGARAADWPLLVADSADPATLTALARSTAVLTSTVGPYARHGLPLVAACAAEGTHYADLTGEPLFVRRSIDLAHQPAVASGARAAPAAAAAGRSLRVQPAAGRGARARSPARQPRGAVRP